jgi:hypothetical protein
LALQILGQEFKAIAGMVRRMLHKNQFTQEAIECYFTLPSGDEDVHMLEALNDILDIRLEKKYENKVKIF